MYICKQIVQLCTTDPNMRVILKPCEDVCAKTATRPSCSLRIWPSFEQCIFSVTFIWKLQATNLNLRRHEDRAIY